MKPQETVIISLDTYNELRDFNEKVSEGKIQVKDNYPYSCTSTRSMYLYGFELKELIEEKNKELAKELDIQVLKNEELKSKINIECASAKLQAVQSRDKIFVNMSIWEFIKWRKRQ